MRYIKINNNSLGLLEKFIDVMGNSKRSFRYYDKRSLEATKNHLYTIIGVNKRGYPHCYGHLDKEKNKVWLGVCVIEGQIGKGLGEKTVKKLLKYAEKNKINKIYLSVDNNNISAINLYLKMGFTLSKKETTKSFYTWESAVSEKRRNIIWLHTHFYYWMGGTKFIYEVAQKLEKASKVASFTIVVENTSQFSKEQFEKGGIHIVNLNSLTSTNPIYWLLLPVFIWKNTIKIKEILKERKLAKANTTIITSMFPMNIVAQKIGYKHIQNCYEPFAFFYDREFIKRFPY